MASMKLQQAPPDALQLAASMASAWARVALSLCGCAPADGAAPKPFSAPPTKPKIALFPLTPELIERQVEVCGCLPQGVERPTPKA